MERVIGHKSVAQPNEIGSEERAFETRGSSLLELKPDGIWLAKSTF